MDDRSPLPVNTVLDGSYRIACVVGSGGFGITYEAEDVNLGTMVAIKEYYPFDFGDRDRTMSVRPKSDRHKQTFEWGRSNFLQEARTLARFEHPSIVRVTRVFEANSTAYMVMRFEQGQSFEEWLRGLGRPPTQEELDFVIAPLLDALQMMHAANFLHRDIAPDNIIIRTDGTPVLLDFGAARRAVAEMSRSLTGIVKAGYSPHEQYTSDSRLQGPWSDLYAFGGTLYRAVTGKAPEEATLRFDEDRMPPAALAAKGKYRRDFLGAIDTCLKVRHSERPRSVAQLRPMLLGGKSQPKGTARLIESTYKLPREDAPSTGASTLRQVGSRRWLAIAAAVAVVSGAYGGFDYRRWSSSEGENSGRVGALSTAETQRKAAAEAAQRQAALEAEDSKRRRRRHKRASVIESRKPGGARR